MCSCVHREQTAAAISKPLRHDNTARDAGYWQISHMSRSVLQGIKSMHRKQAEMRAAKVTTQIVGTLQPASNRMWRDQPDLSEVEGTGAVRAHIEVV